jgi:type IV fimbrial biogenesis protein FimT
MKTTTCRGWTLVEAMMTLSIIGILSSVALPPLKDMLWSVQRDAIAGQALSALRLARSEAIKRDGQVILCKSSSSNGCADSGDWDQGWFAFHDANGNVSWDSGEEVVLQREALPPGWRMYGNSPLAQYVAYRSLGETKLPSGAFQAGTFTVCKISPHTVSAVRIVINRLGRPRLETVRIASC